MTLTLPKCDHPCLPAVQFESVCHLVREPLATLRSCLSEPSPAVHYADGIALRLFDAKVRPPLSHYYYYYYYY